MCGRLAGDAGNSRFEPGIEGVPVENLMGHVRVRNVVGGRL